MIVVDTNIISYLLLPTNFTTRAEALYLANPQWLAPVLWRSEFRNVLAQYLRKKILTFEQALLIQAEAEALMQEGEYEMPSLQVLNLVNESSCSAYDCEFAALALTLNIPLVTEDKTLLKCFPGVAVSLADSIERE